MGDREEKVGGIKEGQRNGKKWKDERSNWYPSPLSKILDPSPYQAITKSTSL